MSLSKRIDGWLEEDVKRLTTVYVTRKPMKVSQALLYPEYAIAPGCFNIDVLFE